jgi:hypothetical protein
VTVRHCPGARERPQSPGARAFGVSCRQVCYRRTTCQHFTARLPGDMPRFDVAPLSRAGECAHYLPASNPTP